MSLRRLLGIAALATLVAGPAFAQCDTRFVVRNQSGLQVNEFYFGPSSDSNWGPDRLGANVLPNGAAMTFNTGRPGPHDFKVVWPNGQYAELMRLDICVTSEIVATPNGIVAR
ncbi:hypothetical protein [Muricoccus radiodurans]|uniref:hypothetical protein n=1 Tax=Muricoccus radiodurans TaxID=2231721 RepID=UPI003CF6519E